MLPLPMLNQVLLLLDNPPPKGCSCSRLLLGVCCFCVFCVAALLLPEAFAS
jgi:hypothetical protein